jgi:hypothetical protein
MRCRVRSGFDTLSGGPVGAAGGEPAAATGWVEAAGSPGGGSPMLSSRSLASSLSDHASSGGWSQAVSEPDSPRAVSAGHVTLGAAFDDIGEGLLARDKVRAPLAPWRPQQRALATAAVAGRGYGVLTAPRARAKPPPPALAAAEAAGHAEVVAFLKSIYYSRLPKAVLDDRMQQLRASLPDPSQLFAGVPLSRSLPASAVPSFRRTREAVAAQVRTPPSVITTVMRCSYAVLMVTLMKSSHSALTARRGAGGRGESAGGAHRRAARAHRDRAAELLSGPARGA